MTQESRPLDGLRVLDLSRAVSGPFAGRILADLGADVVRAELPGTDVTQAFGKVIRGRSGLYSHVNAGKRSIVLDLHQPGDVTRLLDLAAACDVVVENFRPGVLDRFGAGWPALSAVNEGDAVHLRLRPAITRPSPRTASRRPAPRHAPPHAGVVDTMSPRS
jgi:CoA:oxalate CoA-transferase